MDIYTNSFCAVRDKYLLRLALSDSMFIQGGNVLGNGTWLNIGGNQAVTYGGAQATSQFGGPPYNDPDGRRS